MLGSAQHDQFTVKKKRNIFFFLKKGVSLYAEPYNIALQNCHENIPANRKTYLSAFPVVIMKKLMMFYSLKQKLFTPGLVDMWKDDIISIFLMIMKGMSA